jgi:hypothetical protein
MRNATASESGTRREFACASRFLCGAWTDVASWKGMALKHLWLLVLGLCWIGCGKSDMTACPPWGLCGAAVTAAGVTVTPSATAASNAPPTGDSIVNPGAAAAALTAAPAEPKAITLLPAAKAKAGGRGGGGGYSSSGRGGGGGGYSNNGRGTTRASEPAREKRANGAKCMDDKECASGSCNAHYVCQGNIE